jgi:DNA processing protein
VRSEREADGTAPWPDGFGRGSRNRAALLVLASLPSLLPRHLAAAAHREGSAAGCLRAVREGNLGSEADRAVAHSIDAHEMEAALRHCGARLVAPDDEDYVRGLGHLADPPAALFVRGRVLSELAPRVAVVGARNCSLLGRDVASELGSGLAAAGVTVVSGAARGIDGASHRGALEAGGHTVAVLGSGIDVAYPKQHARMIERIAAAGAVISEYPPGAPPIPFRFPARNRIIAALVEAVVVVEGAAGSGSMITADHALDLGRPVYAVPGPVNSSLAEVPLALVREGAGMIRSSADLLADLGRLDPRAGSVQGIAESLPVSERAVWEALGAPSLPEQLARSTGLELGDVLSILVDLELRGLIRTVGGRVERRLIAEGATSSPG